MAYSQVIALDAATGGLLWRYKRPLPEGFSALHNTSRGVALSLIQILLVGSIDR